MTEAVRRISAQELKRRMEAGEALVFDVRKKEMFDRGHVKGAQPMPIKDWATWVREIPRGRGIVFY